MSCISRTRRVSASRSTALSSLGSVPSTFRPNFVEELEQPPRPATNSATTTTGRTLGKIDVMALAICELNGARCSFAISVWKWGNFGGTRVDGADAVGPEEGTQESSSSGQVAFPAEPSVARMRIHL